MDQFQRTRMLLGDAAVELLREKHVAVFGVGGVGGHVVEVLARSGVGAIDIIDNDRVNITNINRQIIALHSTVGQLKVDVMEQRILDINPDCTVRKFATFYLPANADEFDLTKYDYVVDCIDTVSAKVELVRRCHALNIRILSCMGAANKMDATAFRITDISKTSMDPLAKVIRKRLRKLNIDHLKVVFSEEQPTVPMVQDTCNDNPECSGQSARRPVPASNAFVPAAAGLIAGGEVIKDIIGWKKNESLRKNVSSTILQKKQTE